MYLILIFNLSFKKKKKCLLKWCLINIRPLWIFLLFIFLFIFFFFFYYFFFRDLKIAWSFELISDKQGNMIILCLFFLYSIFLVSNSSFKNDLSLWKYIWWLTVHNRTVTFLFFFSIFSYICIYFFFLCFYL